MTEEIKLEQGKIYFISYSSNTQCVGRFKEEDTCNYKFYDLLHYWNGSETFREDDYCARSGIEELRRATKAEKWALIKEEVSNDCI